MQKWRWYERNSLPLEPRAHPLRVRAQARLSRAGRVHGNVLEMFTKAGSQLGEHVLLEPNVWLTAPAPGRIRIGGGTFLNLGVQVAAVELVEIGEHCMFANGCFVTDGNHRFDDPDKPITWQGFTTKGPTRIGDNVWCGANVVVTSGVTIGERCVIGANSVVTTDLPPFSIAAGAPARVLRHDHVLGALGQHDLHAEDTMRGEHASSDDHGEQAVADRRAGRDARAAPRRSAPVPSTTNEYDRGDPDAGQQRDPDHLDDLADLDDAEQPSPRALRGHRAAGQAAREEHQQRQQQHVTTTTGPTEPSPKRRTTP